MATTSGSGLGIVRAQLPDQDVLGVVGVLVLIDQHMPEPAAILLAQVREGLQQVHGGHDQVVEVQRVGRHQPALILPVRLRVALLDGRARSGGRRLVVDQLVLAAETQFMIARTGNRFGSRSRSWATSCISRLESASS